MSLTAAALVPVASGSSEGAEMLAEAILDLKRHSRSQAAALRAEHAVEIRRQAAAEIEALKVEHVKAIADLTAGDGLHPSGAMYSEWAKLVLPRVRAVL